MDGLWTEVWGQQKQSNDPGNNQHNPRHPNDWAPRTRKRHQQEHGPQRPTERSDPTQHAKGRTGDCPGPRKGATRRNVTQGGGGARGRSGSPAARGPAGKGHQGDGRGGPRGPFRCPSPLHSGGPRPVPRPSGCDGGEAEVAKRGSGVYLKSSWAGFTGTGYLDYQNSQSNQWVEWLVDRCQGGVHSLKWRYTQFYSRPLQLKVNGATVVSALNFPATANWENWQTVTATATLDEGANAIRLTHTGTGGPNIDSMTVVSGTAAPYRPANCGEGGGNNQHNLATTSTSSIRQLWGAADAQTAHPATFSTAPAHQLLGSANAETTPARAPAAAADRTQRPDATCEGKNG